MAKRKPKAQPEPSRADPRAMTIQQLAEFLTQSGGRKIAASALAADVEAGAPVNGDGTVNLLKYAAWLAGGQN